MSAEMLNDEYWLAYAKKSTENSLTARNEGAAKLEKMVLWFWGLYTASFTIGVSINAIDAPVGVLAFLALPIVTLIATYWLCIWTQMPVTSQFDPRIPHEIMSGYNTAVREKTIRFNLSLIGTVISSLSLAGALFALAFVDKKESISVKASFNTKKDRIIISGTLPKNATVITTVDTGGGSSRKSVFYSNIHKTQDNGFFNLNIPADTTSKSYGICVEWEEGGKDNGYFKNLTR